MTRLLAHSEAEDGEGALSQLRASTLDSHGAVSLLHMLHGLPRFSLRENSKNLLFPAERA